MKKTGKLSKILKRNYFPVRKESWKAIILCMITAFTFWFFNALDKNYTTTLNYPIYFEFNRDSLVSTSGLPDEIEIIASGGGWQLLRRTVPFSKNPVLVTFESPVDVQFITASGLLPYLQNEFQELQIVGVLTDTITIKIEPIIQNQVKLNVDTSFITFQTNFFMQGEISFDPDSLLLTGPSSYLQNIGNELIIAPEERNVNRNYSENLQIRRFLDPLIKSDPSSVNVQFEVIEYERVPLTITIDLLNFPQDSSWVTEKQEVSTVVLVQKNYRDQISASDFTLYVDYEQTSWNDSTAEVEVLYTPIYVKNIDILDSTIKVSSRN